MKIFAVYACDEGLSQWQAFFQSAGVSLIELAGMDDPRAHETSIALAWLPPAGYLSSLPNLQLICSLGMGVNGIADDPDIPEHIPIVRLVDRNIAAQIAEYVLGDIIRVRRRFEDYRVHQQQQRWKRCRVGHAADTIVTVLGLGVIGSEIARTLSAMGYQVRGWRHRRESVPGINTFCGSAEWSAAIADAQFIVNALPLTAATAGILNRNRLQGIASGAHLINIARGDHLREADLLPMLASGQLGSATLDVTRQEPLPADHPFWQHPAIRITPYISGITYPEHAAAQIIRTIRDFCEQKPLKHVVDRAVGY